MATYLLLAKYTHQGITNIKESPNRVDASRQAFQSLGGELKTIYLTMGQYDLVAVIEAPDDETMAKVALALGSRGNVSTETLRAFSEDEFRSIVTQLP